MARAELRLLDHRRHRLWQHVADLVGLVPKDNHNMLGACLLDQREHARDQWLAEKFVEHLVPPRTHPRALSRRQDHRNERTGTQGCPARIRTWIATSKVWSPTIGRPGTVAAAQPRLRVLDGL